MHLSDVEAREEFRRVSVVRDLCFATVKGKGVDGYREALDPPQGGAPGMSATRTTTTRADRLADVLGERDLHALLVTDLTNVRWLTGFTGSSGAAVVGVDGTRRFVTDFRYLTQSAEQLDESWAREISSDLLEGVVKQLPDEGDAAPRLRRRAR